MNLNGPLSTIKGVGPALEKSLKTLGLNTIRDLIEYYPRAYEDYSHISSVKDLQPGHVTIRAILKHASGRHVRRGMHITEAVFSDSTGSVRVTWFNQPYRAAALSVGQTYYVSGSYELSYQRFQILNPSAELVKDFPVNTARIVPVYKQSKNVSTIQIRKILANCMLALQQLPETLPDWILSQEKLLTRQEAYQGIHFPSSSQNLEAARRRLAFEEVFTLCLSANLTKADLNQLSTVLIPFDKEIAQKFVGNLPFNLTPDQRRVVWQIYQDLSGAKSAHAMNRLVEGDVGSGKTVVAAMATLMVIEAGYQVAVLAPTELLARQHANTFTNLFSQLGREKEILLLVGSMSARQKANAHSAICQSKAKVVIGTHAILQDSVVLEKLGLVIIDEQHRFGVEQRKKLLSHTQYLPHMMSLTATPIPRTLALTLYGELSISRLQTKPQGRLPISTKLVPAAKRLTMYDQIKNKIVAGEQVYVVCPLIEVSDDSLGKAATDVYEELKNGPFSGVRIGLLHGRLKAEQKDQIMQAFASGMLDVLVSTTVIEVGVDVENATVMVVESADRFGLAQLHQLRGRVGRGQKASKCYLLVEESQNPSKRLRAIASSQDGFRLAELDLELRGPGAIYGQLQHGALDLRIAELSDIALIEKAKEAADEFVERGEELVQYKELHHRVKNVSSVTQLN